MYPGGLKETLYKDMMQKKPEEVRFIALSILLHVLTNSADYTPRCLWNVAQKQATRPST